jgi:hypothetical protein
MINYGLIHKASLFYEQHDFQRIEVPWTVTKEISAITKPAGRRDIELIHENHKVLVASGEQSFLYQYSKNYLPRGQYVCVTPCHRFEDHTSWNVKSFIKCELIKTDSTTRADLDNVIELAKAQFLRYFPADGLNVKDTSQETGEISFDIEFRGVELGSYGIRSCDFLQWIFATGWAEPRTSRVMEKFHITIPE